MALAACSGPILANPGLDLPAPPSASPAAVRSPDPLPVSLPRDDGPHDRLTEWWYYTGHLVTADGRRFGFEAVIFRAERGDVPPAWAAHLALTDEGGQRFLYAQRSQVGTAVDRSPRGPTGATTGFDLQVSGADPAAGSAADKHAWRLAGSDGRDQILAVLSPPEAAAAGAAFGLDLTLVAERRPVLHDLDGFVDFGPAGSSYYYSRTRLAVRGSLMVDGTWGSVTGQAWFDHQWGDFIAVGGGGWDWFAINLDDGTDITLSLVHDANGAVALAYGTLVDADGHVERLDASAFQADALATWTSPRTGMTYPMEWSIDVPAHQLFVELKPTLPDQELDTRASTGVVYWEGSQTVSARRAMQPVGGEAYVEVTRYAAPGP
jgi:predicted secreted hydrolase